MMRSVNFTVAFLARLFQALALFILVSSEVALANANLSEKYNSGREIYNYRCYYCHGYAGDAKTLAARFVTPKPVDFTSLEKSQITTERMIVSITNGREGTAMPAFGNTISDKEISDVIYFIEEGFINAKETKSGYHTTANGWQDHHEKYASAFPFVLGEISVNTPETELSIEQQKGREIFFNGCISCHEVIAIENREQIWQSRAVSYPRSHSPFREPDAITQATVYSKHEVVDISLSRANIEGNDLFQQNCAFCHSADGTGKNWIGNFLEPHPRDLTDAVYLQTQTLDSLSQKIALGVADSSMPRWDRVLSRQQIEKIACFLLRAVKDITVCNRGQVDDLSTKMNGH